MDFFKTIWHKYLGGKATPWASIKYVNGRMSVKAYNKAFADSIRAKHNIFDENSDDEVVQLFADRETIEQEEPRLDVTHSGITEDGRIKMNLDWNPSFIRHLADNGITAETEEEAVQQYLVLITNVVSQDMLPNKPTRDDVDKAFREIEEETAAELQIASDQIKDLMQAKLPRNKAR